jgi:eukaryotic-like serine/threonine-protein kinase
VMDGSLLGVGGRYVIALRLVSAQTGEELATFRESADTQSEILPAVDRLAKEVRAKIGESLKHVQGAPPLEQVTTSSLEALKKYVQGVRVIGDGDFAKGAALLEEAVAIDTGFAMAYRKLGIEYGNRQLREKALGYYELAVRHLDRLTDAERYLLLGSYHALGKRHDLAKSTAAYEQLLEIQPNNTAGLNNLGVNLLFLGQYARAESLLVRAIAVGPVATVHYRNLARARVALGKRDSARTVPDACAKAFPKNLECQFIATTFWWQQRQFDSVAAASVEIDAKLTDPATRIQFLLAMVEFARMRGKLSEAERLVNEAHALMTRAGLKGADLDRATQLAFDRVWFREDAPGALRVLDDAVERTPPRSLPLTEAPYGDLVVVYALAGRVDRARPLMAEWERRRPEASGMRDTIRAQRMRALVAIAEGRYADAQAALRPVVQLDCPVCELPLLGRAYDLGGARDSAIAVYERFITTPWLDRTEADGAFLGAVHKRLGELYEAKGMREKALEHYRAFIELWKEADPELQPQVTNARQRVAALTRGTDVR